MTEEQRLAPDALECFTTCVRKIHDLQRASTYRVPATSVLLVSLSLTTFQSFIDLGQNVGLDFAPQIKALHRY